MIEIPRYRMTNNFCHQDNDSGAWVRYGAYLAAVKAAVEAERIRCLGIVENIQGYYSMPESQCGDMEAEACGEWINRAETEYQLLSAAVTPEPKFKVGDRVRNDMFVGTVTEIETYDYQEDEFWVAWDAGGQSQCDYRTLTLYVPPTPAELIHSATHRAINE